MTQDVSRFTFHVSRLAALCLTALALAATARADVAPPEMAPGSNISPGSQTQVVMSTERVVIEVQPAEESAIGKVKGDFVMRNTGPSEEQLKVRFPLGDPIGGGNARDFPTVENFAVSVGGNILLTTVITTPNPLANLGQTEPVKWAAFDVKFPAGQDVTINVTYTIKATGYPPSARFAYVLETGAGWKDAIGSADIVLRLPYQATNQNVFYEGTSPGSKLAGNEVRWHWDKLEPTPLDNLRVTILAPKTWQAILAARADVQAKPGDATALTLLARAYDAAITTKFPTDEHDPFGTLSEETYERAVTAAPEVAPLHVEYARTIWDHMFVMADISQDDPNLRRVLAQISEALAIDPQNQGAKALLAEVQTAVETPIVLPTPVNVKASPTATQGQVKGSPTVRATATTAATPIINVTADVAPTRTVLPPVQTVVGRPTATISGGASSQSGDAGTLLLVIGIIALPVIAALATFLLVRRRREQSGPR